MPEHLISTDELARLVGSPQLRIADVRWYLGEPDRGRAEYASGHLPGAVFLDLDTDLSAADGPGRHPLPDRDVFAATMGRLGFGDEHVIVGYDSSGGSVAGRLWWMLRDIGHPAPRVLDGGMHAWIDAGHHLSVDSPCRAPTNLTVGESQIRKIDRTQLAQSLGELALIDVRAAERYRGEVEPVDPAAGHIPSAVNIPFAENLDADGRFLPPFLLAARYRSVAGGRDIALYCGSGVNACQTALAMAVAGLPEPIIYPGSWSDWSSAGMEVAVGPDPGGD
jgi:thiosulfate/3-mercaptopyruvate sulfurtransferase